MTWAVKQKVGNATGKAILLMLANYADEAGECFPSQVRLARECECSIATVARWLKHFMEVGIIEKRKQYGDGGYRRADRIKLAKDLPVTELPSTELPNSVSKLTRHSDGAEPIREPISSPSLRSGEARAKPKRASRLSENWKLPVDWRQDALDLGLPEPRIDAEAAKMLDWSLSSPSGAKLDWRAVWRNWCRKAAEERPAGNARASPPQKDTAPNAIKRRLEAIENERRNANPDDHQPAPKLLSYGA